MIVFIIVILIVLTCLFVKYSKDISNQSSKNTAWKELISENTTNSTEVINAISDIVELLNVDPVLVTAVCYAESLFDVYAAGDYVQSDDFIGSRCTSFGLMQINTRKKNADQYSTFDYICAHATEYDIIISNNLHQQSVRNDIVRLASLGVVTSLIFDPHINVFLGTWYLKQAGAPAKVEGINEALHYLYKYNAGLGANEDGFDIWYNDPSRRNYIGNFEYALRYCSLI